MCRSMLQCAAFFLTRQQVGHDSSSRCGLLQVSQCVALICSVLQCVAVCCSVLQCLAAHCLRNTKSGMTPLLVTVCCSALQCVAVGRSVLQCVA